MVTADKIYVCLSCGETNTYFTTCEKCEPETDKYEPEQFIFDNGGDIYAS